MDSTWNISGSQVKQQFPRPNFCPHRLADKFASSILCEQRPIAPLPTSADRNSSPSQVGRLLDYFRRRRATVSSPTRESRLGQRLVAARDKPVLPLPHLVKRLRRVTLRARCIHTILTLPSGVKRRPAERPKLQFRSPPCLIRPHRILALFRQLRHQRLCVHPTAASLGHPRRIVSERFQHPGILSWPGPEPPYSPCDRSYQCAKRDTLTTTPPSPSSRPAID